MSIETLIQEHTAALLANTEAVKQLTLSLAGRTPSKTEEKPVKTETKKVEPKAEEPKREEPKAEVEDDLAGGNEGSAVAYADVRALVLKLAPNHREAIKGINTKHGITKLPDLLDDANDFATVNNPEKLAAVFADLQALGGE